MYKIRKNLGIVSIVIVYFVLRLVFLTTIPVFNDEAIYLDWGWRETHSPGYLFYSLYDAKQPLLMWFFGISQIIFTDPLFAGRFVSVLAGFLSLIGIYVLAKELIHKKPALFVAALYAVTPIFSFFDRQALMESAITAAGIWACYFALRFFKTSERKYVIYSGIVLGVGFFIKSTALIFLFAYVVLFLHIAFTNSHKRRVIVKSLGILLLVFLGVSFLILIQPLFWQTFSSNSRYSLGFREIIGFPITLWMRNIVGNIEIAFFHLTPFVFLSGVAGIFLLLRSSSKYTRFALFFYLMCMLQQTFLTRFVSSRYLVAFLPVFLLASGYLLEKVFSRSIAGKFVALFVFVCVITVTVVQVVDYAKYFTTMQHLTRTTDFTYISGVTSGFGVAETVSFLDEQSQKQPIFVGVAQNSGNPESAVIMYFNKHKNVVTTYFDSSLLPDTSMYDCIYTGRPTYFVSRDEQLAGLNRFLIHVKTVYNPYSENRIGIYALKSSCEGRTLELTIVKT